MRARVLGGTGSREEEEEDEGEEEEEVNTTEDGGTGLLSGTATFRVLSLYRITALSIPPDVWPEFQPEPIIGFCYP